MIEFNRGIIVLLVFGLFAVGWLISTWIRAKYGYPLDDGAGNPVHRETPPRSDVLNTVESALADRDAKIATLEERIRVLERIATDRGVRLSEEIEGLR